MSSDCAAHLARYSGLPSDTCLRIQILNQLSLPPETAGVSFQKYFMSER